MQQLNSIHLRGITGHARTVKAGGTRMCQLTLATNCIYRRESETVVETTWHNVNIYERAGMPDLDTIKKGTKLEITGRLRMNRYTAASGEQCNTCEVIASNVTILPDEEPLLMEETA